jgi:malate synthase
LADCIEKRAPPASGVDADAFPEAFRVSPTKVDAQNAGDPLYAIADDPRCSLAFQAGRALVFEGVKQPSGYTALAAPLPPKDEGAVSSGRGQGEHRSR